MPLSEENKALMDRVAPHHTPTFGGYVYCASQLEALLNAAREEERAKAQALGGGRESSSAVDESAASVLTDLTEQQRGASLEWRPIASAPRDGTRILTWCVHRNATYSKDPIGEGWAAAVIAEWTDFNGGGWVWHGLCGEHALWQPLPRPPAEIGLSGRQGSNANTSAGTEALDEH